MADKPENVYDDLMRTKVAALKQACEDAKLPLVIGILKEDCEAEILLSVNCSTRIGEKILARLSEINSGNAEYWKTRTGGVL